MISIIKLWNVKFVMNQLHNYNLNQICDFDDTCIQASK